MDKTEAFDSIDATTFAKLLKQYPEVVPDKLAELEQERLVTIPAALEARREVDGKDVHLTKPELATLMKWKLSHGKFRPSLAKLIDDNSPQTVIETTTEGFKPLLSKSPDTATIQSSLKILSALRGVGPATASLLLSTLAPAKIPFFSDELLRWAFFADPSTGGAGKGWERKIKYNAKEYGELIERVWAFQDRIEGEVSCIDIEKVAYVLGKRTQTSSADGEDTGDGKGVKRKASLTANDGKQTEPPQELPSQKRTKKTSKQPSPETKAPSRRSSRNKE